MEAFLSRKHTLGDTKWEHWWYKKCTRKPKLLAKKDNKMVGMNRYEKNPTHEEQIGFYEEIEESTFLKYDLQEKDSIFLYYTKVLGRFSREQKSGYPQSR